MACANWGVYGRADDARGVNGAALLLARVARPSVLMSQRAMGRLNQLHHAWYAIVVFVAQRGAVAAIAQLGERQTEDLKVPGSIPGLGTCFSYRRGRPLSSTVGPMMHHHSYASLGSWLLTPAS